ncbi:hypothetical protein JTB14_020290 [Gonioctena quinquepunctata]|nr:hypothetical protein JTB14_020290 [Gonioctena quinquepunctata]
MMAKKRRRTKRRPYARMASMRLSREYGVRRDSKKKCCWRGMHLRDGDPTGECTCTSLAGCGGCGTCCAATSPTLGLLLADEEEEAISRELYSFPSRN